MVSSSSSSTASNKLRKRVSFVSSLPSSSSSPLQGNEPGSEHQHPTSAAPSHSCHYYCDGLDKEERKALCWYSPQDLQPCRDEVRETIQQLQSSLQSGVLLEEEGEDSVCLRGVEKYADAAGKYRKQRIYIESILQQQRLGGENLANLSRYLSQASTELALFYARRCAAELSLLRHEEEDEHNDDDDDDWEDDDEGYYVNEDSSLCSSQMDVHESKVSSTEAAAEVCVDPSLSSKRKRSRCLAFGDDMPPRKIQCCE